MMPDATGRKAGWIDALLRQPLLTLILAVVIAAAGIQAWLNLPIDAFPDISPTQVKIILKVPGMTPEEVEQRVIAPIELEMLGLPRKQMVRSLARYGIADVTIDFDEGTDIYWARQQVSEHLSGVMRDLPAGAIGGLAPITTPLGEMFMFTLQGDFTLAEKRRVLDWVIRPALRTVPGVADVNQLGGEVRAYEVIPDPARMAARGVSLDDLRRALTDNNRNDGAGRLGHGEETLIVRMEGIVRSLDDLRRIQLPLAGAQGGYVSLDEVASVRLGSVTRYGAVTRDGRGETVEGLVLGLRGANARAVVDDVRAELQRLAPRLPGGMTVDVFYDRGDLVGRAVDTVVHALAEAAVLVVIVLYLFLGGIRAALVVAVSLPLSLLASFVLMRQFGLTANLMSLGGLAVALGMLVDGAVVVVENIESSLVATSRDARRSVVAQATAAVVRPVTAGIAIIAIVFLPLLSLQGLEGKLFAPAAMTIVLALAASLVIAFTVVPSLAGLLLKTAAVHHEPWLMRLLGRAYERLLAFAFRAQAWVYAVAVLALIAAALLYLHAGKTFMPTMDEGDLIVQLRKLPTISLPASVGTDTRIQQALLAEVPEIRSIVARVGADDIGLDPMGFNESDTFLVLKPRSQWRGDKEAIAADIRRVMTRFPGVVYSFTQPIEMRVSEMLTGARGDVVIKLFGNDLDQLRTASQQVADAVRKVRGAGEVVAPPNEGVEYLSMRIDRTLAGRAGFSIDALQERLRAQIEGETLGIVPEGTVRTPLVLRGAQRIRDSVASLSQMTVTAPDGRAWPLSSLAAIQADTGPVQIAHEMGSRFASIQVSVDNRDLSGFVDDARRAVAGIQGLPKDLRIEWGGQFENQQRAARRLALVVPVALGAIFVLLTITFGSVREALLIFANIPFALVGGIAALSLSGEYLSVPASVGFIALLGIAVLNGVVMVSHFNELLAQGMDLVTAVRQGARRRLRPVLMTATITAFGMLPLLSATGPGSEIQRPLAIVVAGGLVSSTLLTLVLLPLMFVRFGKRPEVPVAAGPQSPSGIPR